MDEITVVGGGLAGLIAASEVAEAGTPVRLIEAHGQLGGRARATSGDYVANHGPHALYTGTELWGWLRRRGLEGPSRRPPWRHAMSGVWFRWKGAVRRTPPAALLPALRMSRRAAPLDDLRSWVSDQASEDTARAVSGLAGPLVFDHDAGRLSAAFVMDKVRSILLQPSTPARYVEGGWSALVERIAAHARSAGAVVELGRRVDALDDLTRTGPVIVAVDPPAARALLEDDGLRPEATRVALLDVGLRHRRGDPYLVFDLDEAAFVDRFSAVLPALAPAGEDLVQSSVGLRPGEGLESGVARIEAVLDGAFAGWRERVTWRRRGLMTEATGALDLPGTTWRDRPAVGYEDGVWLAGDWVAAPGHLAEVACTSALQAARQALAARRREPLDV